MVSRIVTPESRTVTIEIPEEFVNKRLHVEIWEEPGADPVTVAEPDDDAFVEVNEFYAAISVDLGQFVFDRDDAHER